MTSSTLEAVPAGIAIFIDSSIFIYHFTGVSAQCREFLERCERGEVKATTSVVCLAEVAHRLMATEAVTKGLITPGNAARKLRDKPEIVRQLDAYQENVEKIALMGIGVEALDLSLMLRSAFLRKKTGLLTNDSLIATTLATRGLSAIASGDPDFSRLEGVELFGPTDLTKPSAS